MRLQPCLLLDINTSASLLRGPTGDTVQIKLLGQSLYYLLTTGSGQQTLGEEYCDISQVWILKGDGSVVP
ncbi:unnamed protein product [Urochloa humidicola]